MNDKKFNAILYKNEIARQLREAKADLINVKKHTKEGGKAWILAWDAFLSINTAMKYLVQLEGYLGQANQPSVKEIFTSDRNDI